MAIRTTSLAGAQTRRAEIDWLRGLAVLFMVLWHVVDAWHVPANRDTAAFSAVVFFAGWAAPMFLFFAGVSVPLAAHARMARGCDRRAAVQTLVRRGWQVFLLAHLFRFQSFIFSPGAAWSSLLKPDILNILGLGLVLAALAWGRARSRLAEWFWLLLPTLVVAVVLTPWVRVWEWPTLLHPRIEGYLRVSGGNAVFSLFPALAYVFAGAFVGSALARAGDADGTFYRKTAALGAGLVAVALASRWIPLSAGATVWTSPALIVALRVGAMLVSMAVVAKGLQRVQLTAADPLLAFGRASLIVYWVHVELAYGAISHPLHKTMTLPWALSGYLLVTAAMYALAIWWIRRRRLPLLAGLAARVRRPMTGPVGGQS